MQNKMLCIYEFCLNNGNKYIFDNVTGIVVPTNEIISFLIHDYFSLKHKESLGYLTNKFKITDDELMRYYVYVEKLIQQGMFYKENLNKYDNQIDYKNELLKTSSSQLILNITKDCNLRCRYCIFSEHYPDTKGYAKEVMTFEIAKESIDYFMELHAKKQSIGFKKNPYISFFGGEPLLEFKLIKNIVTYCKEKNMTQYFT